MTNRDDQAQERTWDKESVYDEQIAPLMTQIIETCKEHKIPMFASFQYSKVPGDAMFCTTALLDASFQPDKRMYAAFKILRDGLVAFSTRVIGG